MVNCHISDDLKMAALQLKARGHNSTSEILQIVQFSWKMFYNIHCQYHATGTVTKAQAIGRGQPQKAIWGNAEYFICLACHKPVLFLDEYQWWLQKYRDLSLSMSTIHHGLAQAGLNVKHVQKIVSERDPILCADFVCHISQYPATSLLVPDEVLKDNRTYAHLWGHSKCGSRVEIHQPFVRKQWFSMLATMALNEGVIASQVVEGSFTRDLFLQYLHDDLVSSSLCSEHFLIFGSYFFLSFP